MKHPNDMLQMHILGPFAKDGWYCNNIKDKCSLFGKMLDSSIIRLKVKPRDVHGGVANSRDGREIDTIFETIHEDRGFDALKQDDYDKYYPEPNDGMIRAMGSTIINSMIELIDSSGLNRIIVRRNSSRV